MSALSVIIVGAPRSGTYWVVDLLKARFGIAIPSETHFIPLFRKYLWLWGDLSVRKNRERLLKSILEFVSIWTPRSSHSSEYVAQIRQLSLLATLDSGRTQKIVDASHDYPSLIEALFHQFAEQHDSDIAGDKSAHYRVTDPAQVFDLFPQAVMLHVIRDGRDVATSWIKQWFGPSSIEDAARLWREHVEVNRSWGEQNPQRYHEVRYEDLALDPEGEINKLSAVLQRPARPQKETQLRSTLARALANTGSHSGMLDIVAAENVARWRKDMPEQELQVFECIAASTLQSSGYELSGQPLADVTPDRVRFSTHSLRVLAKTLLPLALGLCARLGLSPLRMINRRFPLQWREVNLKAASTQAQEASGNSP